MGERESGGKPPHSKMSDVAIKVEGLSKKYRLGELWREDKLRNVLGEYARAPWKVLKREKGEEFWALKDVDLEVKHGEVLGLIGRNGAGKTTLLKILSRITRPTSGWAEVYGRLGSLLEVGTGFHPELSGRDNVYLSGAILGMSKDEIRRKFDEIVAFAEIEKFLDTQVKHYSSGMYVRLAFSVAAHLEPEILLVDEVLAVGDAEFQRKCMGKMEEVSHAGRTILFVSHSVPAVTRLCTRCMLLRKGKVELVGETHDVVGAYLRTELQTTASREWAPDNAPGDNVVHLRAVRVRSVEGATSEVFDIRRPIGIDVVFDVMSEGHELTPNLHVFDEAGNNVFISHDMDPAWRRRPRSTGRYTSTAWIPGNFLAEGTFLVGTAITTLNPQTVHMYERDTVAFQIVDSMDGTSARGDYAGHLPGVVRPLLEWTTAYDPEPEGSQATAVSGKVGKLQN